MGIRGTDYGLNVSGRGGINDASRRLVAAWHRIFAIAQNCFIGTVDALSAERSGNFGEERVEIGCAHDWPLVADASFKNLHGHQIAVAFESTGDDGAAIPGATALGSSTGARSLQRERTGGSSPPVAQSSSSTVCTTGKLV